MWCGAQPFTRRHEWRTITNGWASRVTLTTALDSEELLPVLSARATDAVDIHEAWIEVKPPSFTGTTAVDDTQTSGGGEDLSLFQREVDILQFDSDQNDRGDATAPVGRKEQ